MPYGSGRTGLPGNRNTMKPIRIRTSKPSLLISSGDNLSPASIKGKVPGRSHKFAHKKKGY